MCGLFSICIENWSFLAILSILHIFTSGRQTRSCGLFSIPVCHLSSLVVTQVLLPPPFKSLLLRHTCYFYGVVFSVTRCSRNFELNLRWDGVSLLAMTLGWETHRLAFFSLGRGQNNGH